MVQELSPPVDVLDPNCPVVPIVVSSPHSGRIYPPCLLERLALHPAQLRVLEDGCVDRLFADAPALGVPLVRARFARAYVDANREPYELDPDLLDGPLAVQANFGSAKARAGLGSIPSRVGGLSIYQGRLSAAQIEQRIRVAYRPYHAALQALRTRALVQFGTVLLLDCHSMPGSMARVGNGHRDRVVDVSLGDRYGRACAQPIVDRIATFLSARGLVVARNRPYAGGHITSRYGSPTSAASALQIEIRRGLYMDEATFRPHAGLTPLRALIRDLLADLVELVVDPWPRRSAPRRLAT
jgi:N-formylglutamate amidohydrolase